MSKIRTNANITDGATSLDNVSRSTSGDSWRSWTASSPDEFFYLRESGNIRTSTGASSGGGGGGGGGGGPSINPLHKFATYSWMWSLNVLSVEQTNNPESIFKGKMFRAGITVAEDMGGSDYHFDNVKIKSIISATKGQRGTSALTFAFDIVEPYSLGNFLKDLDSAAQRQGFKNYVEAGLMLAVKFDGWKDDGSYEQVGPYNFIVKLVRAKFTVTEAGTVYQCLAVAWNDQAFNDEVATVKSSGTISGRTVQEILSTGVNSLQAILNEQELKQVEKGVQKEADQYFIVFPKTETSAEEAAVLGTASAGLTDNPIDVQKLWESFKGTGSTGDEGQNKQDNFGGDVKTLQLGVSKSAHDLGPTIRAFYEGNVNKIGLAELKKNPEDPAIVVNTNFDNSQSADDPMVHDPKNSRVPLDVAGTQVNHSQKIVNVIEQVILASKYGREEGAWKPPDGNNKIEWFRITAFVLTTNGPKEDETGRKGKIYIYRVIPYKAAANRIASPGSKGKGGGSPARIYDYIYTGKNTDILKLDLDFNATFYVPVGHDLGQNEQSRLAGFAAGQTDMDPMTLLKYKQGSAGGDEDSLTSSQKRSDSPTRSSGGQLFQHPESALNRYWHETLMNSKVDLLKLNVVVHGDPYFLTSSGAGNFIDSGSVNETSLGQIEYIRSEADIRINFETPYDLGVPWMTTSQYKFTGMYQVLTIDSSFTKGEGFRQTLLCLRHRQQGDGTSSPLLEEGDISNSTTIADQPGTNIHGGP